MPCFSQRIMPLALIVIVTTWTATTCFAATKADASTSVNAGLTLIENGRPQAIIVTPSNRQWQGQSWQIMAEQHAALALQANLLDMTGATLAIVAEKELGDVRLNHDQLSVANAKYADIKQFVFVGLGQVAADTFKLDVDDLPAGGMRILTRGNCLFLIASPELSHPISDGGGIRHAVVTLLESLGFAYLWPGETGKVTPRGDTVVLPAMDITWKPAILQRNIRWAMESPRYLDALKKFDLDPQLAKEQLQSASRTRAADLVKLPNYQTTADLTWAQWQGLGGSVGISGGHAFGDAWTKWGKEHPEWFALQADGTRDQTNAGGRSRLCVSNVELIDAIADDIINEAREHPEQKSFSLSPNDGGYSSFCTCAACEALDAPDAPKVDFMIFDKVGGSARHTIQHASLTDRYVWFWNHIAQRVNKVHPHLLFIIDAYSYYQDPPVRERLDASLVLRYVPNTTDKWAGWKQMGAKRMYWRPNILLRGRKQNKICVYADTLAASIQELANDGMFAMDMDSIVGSWSLIGFNNYVAARVMVNPTRRFEDVLNEYCTTGFGPAAPAIHDYFTHAIKMYYEQGLDDLSLQTLAQLRNDLARADKLVSTNTADHNAIRQRIAFLRLGLNMSELHQHLDDMAKLVADGKPYDQTKADALFDLYFLACMDIAMNHPIAMNVGYADYYSGHFASWRPLKVTNRKATEQTRATIAKEQRSMTGKENSIDEMFKVFDVSQSHK